SLTCFSVRILFVLLGPLHRSSYRRKREFPELSNALRTPKGRSAALTDRGSPTSPSSSFALCGELMPPPTHSLQRGRHGRAPNDRWQDPVRLHQGPEYRLYRGISDGGRHRSQSRRMVGDEERDRRSHARKPCARFDLQRGPNTNVVLPALAIS